MSVFYFLGQKWFAVDLWSKIICYFILISINKLKEQHNLLYKTLNRTYGSIFCTFLLKHLGLFDCSILQWFCVQFFLEILFTVLQVSFETDIIFTGQPLDCPLVSVLPVSSYRLIVSETRFWQIQLCYYFANAITVMVFFN